MQIDELLKKLYARWERKPEYQVLADIFEVLRIYEKDVDYRKAHDLSIELRKTAASMIRADTRYYELYRRALLFDAPADFDSYLLYMEIDREPQKRFYAPRRKTLRVVVDDLQDLEDDKLDLLAISLPPRVGKSTLGIFYVTWLMGKYPELANVMSGHSDKLTKGFYTEALSIITSPDYKWTEIFPNSKVARTSAEDESIDINTVKRFPTLTCRSISGTLTGAVEVGKLLYVDDIIADLEEALNPVRLQNKYDAYLNQLKDRKKDGAKELHIGTRWAPYDVIGRLQEQYADSERHRFRVVPALNENGESNFDYEYGLGFSTQYYIDMKNSIDDATWCAKYMGVPYEREGLLFPPDSLNYYTGSLPDGKPDKVVAVCDVAWGGGDSLAMPFAYVYGDSVYIHDVIFNRGDKETTRPIVVGRMKQHLPNMTRFEANNGGDEYCDNVDRMLRSDGIKLNLSYRKAPNNVSKVTRIIQNSPEIRKFYFIDDKNASPEYRAFMREVTSFTQTGKNRHDDAPDSLAMLVDFLQNGINKVEAVKRPF